MVDLVRFLDQEAISRETQDINMVEPVRAPFTCFRATMMILLVALFVKGTWTSAQERIVHSFDYTNGANPLAGLISDANGNIYGTTLYGGLAGEGTVFELAPESTGRVLCGFGSPGTDGLWPIAGLTFDASGHLFGATEMGGTDGYGVVFELTQDSSDGWNEKFLHNFSHNGDGTYPRANLISDTSGNLYGVTIGGGVYDDGTVFELTRGEDGAWAEKILHSFNATDGSDPSASLILDAAGNLYGTTFYGGSYRSGVVFELISDGGGHWTEKVLHSFSNTDGANPSAGLIFDGAGNLYGTTPIGGANGQGTVFELMPGASGGWREKILHNFASSGTDGHNPWTALLFDASGNLYGTTSKGGAYNWGTAFELTPGNDGNWTEQILHTFNPTGGDGYDPVSALISIPPDTFTARPTTAAPTERVLCSRLALSDRRDGLVPSATSQPRTNHRSSFRSSCPL
jgi:uncharacterized repeat protein (TIGR03803 family)